MPSTRVRDVRVDVLCPIDLDFEPDVERLAAEDQSVVKVQAGPGGAPAIELPRVSLGHVALDGVTLAGEAKLAARVYRFGTGVVRISFVKEDWDLAGLAPISARTEQITVDGRSVLEIARTIGDELRQKLSPYATARYDVRLPTTEAYPVIRVGSLEDAPRGEAFVEAERRAITAITGLPGRDASRLSTFALETAPVINMGPFEGDVVVIREAGAFLHIAQAPRGTGDAVIDEARKISGLIELAYAQYWSIRSVDELTQKLQVEAYSAIARLQSQSVAGGVVPETDILSRLYRAREEHMAVVALIDDLIELPAIGYDVYLDSVFREVQTVFNVPERGRTASDRLEDLERSFEVAHQIMAERRLLVIEVLVLVVIVLEFLLAIFGKH